MQDRERVIKGLEHCSEDGCKDCPYETDCNYIGFTDLAKDALELLKEQEPRVMTLEDVKQAEVGTVVWLEWRIESKINSGIFFRLINKGIDDSLEFHVLDGFVAARLACYGTEWRCWTSRPTDEQRKAVKWDEAD
jgi:hypothetical protein